MKEGEEADVTWRRWLEKAARRRRLPPPGGDDEDQVEEMFGVDVGGDDDRW